MTDKQAKKIKKGDFRKSVLERIDRLETQMAQILEIQAIVPQAKEEEHGSDS
jgi:uncharacterized protein (UPF0335 family)